MNTENELLDRIKNNDNLAFKSLFDQYGKKVYFFINSYLKNKADAEDLTQNVFIRIWESRMSLDTNKSVKGFIFTVAYNTAIDYIRKKGFNELISLSSFSDIALSDKSSSDELVIQGQLNSLYERAVQILPPKRREIFLLSRHDGLTNKQIADHLNISVKTVENQMTAALSSLRDFFSGTNLDLGILFLIFFYLG